MPEPLCDRQCLKLGRPDFIPRVLMSHLERHQPVRCPGCAVLAKIVRLYASRIEGTDILRIGLSGRSDTQIELPYGAFVMPFYRGISDARVTGTGNCIVVTPIEGRLYVT